MPKITGTPDDREQIRELYARYAITIDNSRFEDWVDCFTPDGIFESPIYGQFAGHAKLREFTQSYQRSCVKLCQRGPKRDSMDTIIMSVLLWAAIAAVRGDARVKIWLLYVVAAILIFLRC